MKKRILCFGDSNTWGADPVSGKRHADEMRWTGVLQKELGDDYTVIEEGYNGRTTVFDDDVEDRMAGIKYFKPCIDSQSPLDLIIIMLGTNDLKTRFNVEAKSIAYGFRRYMATLHTTPMEGAQPKVLLAAPILIDPSYKKNPLFCDIFGEDAVERSKGLACAYEEVANEMGWHFMDASLYGKASVYDGVHMEAASHEQLGKAFAQQVKDIIPNK